MLRALELSLGNIRAGRGGPFGSLIVRNGAVLAEGTNLVTSTNDPTAHAEIVAIRRACAALNTFQLVGCDLYTSCEPCPMCLGAIYWARPARVLFAATREDAAAAGFDDSLIYDELALPAKRRRIPMISLLRDEALKVFREWREKPDKIPY
jgi:tRNA(Arg) A34 adenosine deaminase TadA